MMVDHPADALNRYAVVTHLHRRDAQMTLCKYIVTAVTNYESLGMSDLADLGSPHSLVVRALIQQMKGIGFNSHQGHFSFFCYKNVLKNYLYNFQ